jgi:hypothetical protein
MKWYDDPDTTTSGLLNTTNKLYFLIYLILVISIVLVVARYVGIRCYHSYQEKMKTRLNVSKKKKATGIINYIPSIIRGSSSSSYIVIDGDDSISTNTQLGQYYDITSSSNSSNHIIQRRGVIINPIHQDHDIDTTDIRVYDNINV